MREQDRTLECEHSIYGFHKQVNLGERTWNDDLRAMSYSLGIAIVVLVAEQNVILQKSFSRLECCARSNHAFWRD